MNKKINFDFLLIIFGFLFFCNSNILSQKENRKDLNLKGNVKSFKLIHKNFTVQRDSLVEFMPADNDPFWFKGFTDHSYLFDTRGQTLEYCTYDVDDAYVNLTKFFYDEKGKLIKQEFSSDRQKRGYLEFEYDERGRINCIIRSDENDNVTDIIFHLRDSHQSLPLYRSSNNIWVYDYDQNGKCIEEKSYSPSGKLVFRHIFFYDANQRVELMTSYDENNIQNLSIRYEYDKRGNVSQITNVTPVKYTKELISCDSLSNETTRTITETFLQDKNTIRNRFSNVYIYDDNLNWYKKYCFHNGKPSYMQERDIVYYTK